MSDTVIIPNTHELIDQVKEAALAAINELVSHHVKGADLLQKGFTQMCDLSEEIADWYEILKNLLVALKPFFGIIESWLNDMHSHFVDIFNWAKAMWNKIFGSSK
jgi:hypothetical protein